MRGAKLIGAGVVAAFTMALPATPAYAHTALRDANPAAKSTVEAPPEIVLTYTQTISLPKVILTDAGGARHEAGPPRAVDNKVTQPVQGTLPNGQYTVGWRVVSADGHPVAGSYKFTVKGSSAPSPAAPAPAPAPTTAPATGGATSQSSTGVNGWLWIGLAALVVALIAGGVAWARRPRGN